MRWDGEAVCRGELLLLEEASVEVLLETDLAQLMMAVVAVSSRQSSNSNQKESWSSLLTEQVGSELV